MLVHLTGFSPGKRVELRLFEFLPGMNVGKATPRIFWLKAALYGEQGREGGRERRVQNTNSAYVHN